MTVRVEALAGEALQRALPALAQLRIDVFRAYPYLYDGSLAYEEDYVAKFAASPGAVIIAAFDGARIVGAATASPLADHAEEFAAPFRARGFDLDKFFYCGESVLDPAYRGHGIGHRFFDLREEHARSLGGFQSIAFCAVVRPEDHPLRPRDYRPLNAFWTKRGYRPVDGLIAHFSWKDIDQPQATEKPMQFWLRDL